MTETNQATRHRQRWTDISKNFGASVTARLIAAVGGLAQVPFALHHLGAQAYGFWMLLTGMLTLLNIADLGLGIGLQNRMAAHYAKTESAALLGLFNYGLKQLALTGFILAPLFLLAVFKINWSALLNLTDPAVVPLTTTCLFLTVIGFCLNLPLTLATRLAAATQRSWLVPFWGCAGALVQLLAIIVATRANANVVVYVAIFLSVQLLQSLAVLAHLYATTAWLRGDSLAPSTEDRRHLRLAASKFFVQQACGTFSTSFLPVGLSIFGGPLVVTQFNLLQRIFGTLLQVQWMVASPLWPAYTEALARGDRGWIKKSFRASLGFVALLTIALIGCAALMKPLLSLWLGQNPPPIATSLLIATAIWFGGLLVSHPFATLLGGLGHASGGAIYWAATTLIFLGGTCWFGPTHGAVAVAVSAAGAMALVNVPGMIAEAFIRYRQTLKQLARPDRNASVT